MRTGMEELSRLPSDGIACGGAKTHKGQIDCRYTLRESTEKSLAVRKRIIRTSRDNVLQTALLSESLINTSPPVVVPNTPHC
jgi:hypothetical protein